MPLTNAEKNRNYLDRLKENGQYEAYKKKKSAAEKRRRDRIKMGLEQLPKAIREKTKRLNREHSRKRVFEYRQRKRGMVTEMTSNASPMTASNKPAEGYKTASARSKAFAKMRRAMPSAIGLQKELMSKMLRTFDAEDQMEIIQGISLKARPSRGTSQSVIEMVQSFYERDNISRMSLNTKDCCQCVNLSTGIKEVKQIRHLLYKLDDVYEMFVRHVQNGDETKDPPVKSTTFFNLRPKHVKLVGSTPLDTSFCSYHSNSIIPEDMKTECHINGVQGIHQDTCVDNLDRLKHGERDTNLVNCDYRGNATPSTPSTASTIVRQNSLPKEFTAMIQTKTEPMDSFDCET